MTTGNPPSPFRILEIGLAYFASKTLLSAVGLDLFTKLGEDAKTGKELQQVLDLSDRANPDFFDALLALGFLEREGDGPGARYRNTPDTAAFLTKGKEAYVGGILEMSETRLYNHWGNLTEALQTGKPVNEVRITGGETAFQELYKDEALTESFVEGMAGSLVHNAAALAEAYDFSRYQHAVPTSVAQAACSPLPWRAAIRISRSSPPTCRRSRRTQPGRFQKRRPQPTASPCRISTS